ncbi:MAG: 3-hydroxyacyl-CoA dehydrogenase family protein [Chloroflexota bacterium]
MTNEKVAIIGSGLMGHGIAQIFAAAGHPTVVIDPNEASLATVAERVAANLEAMVAHGVTLERPIGEIAASIELATEMSAAADCGFVIEAVFENMDLKQAIFAELDTTCPPETILCSNTSVMSITEIASKATHQARIVGTHFWNPPFLIPLVEVVKGDHSSSAAVDQTYELLASVGKHPVKVQKDVPGFVANRLQHALWREAFAIIDEGIADAATVDECVRFGPGLRWPILGPVENADLVGLDLTKAIHDYILPHLNADPTPSITLNRLVEAGELGFKSGSGFQAWTSETMAATRQRLTHYLLRQQAKEN